MGRPSGHDRAGMVDKMKTIEQEWERYKKEVIPETAGAVQVNECKRAFYGGAAIMFRCMLEASDQQKEEDAMSALFEEVDHFIQSEVGS